MPRKLAPAPAPAPAPVERGPAPEFEERVTPQRSSIADPDVKLPPEVTAASKRADDIWNQVYGQQNQEPPAGDAQAPVSPDTEQPQFPAGEPEADQTEERFAEQPEDPAQQWEHRYNSMRGRHDQLAEQNRELVQRMSWLERQLQTQRTTPAAPQPFAREQQPQKPRLVTEEETAEYGADFLDLVGRRAREDIAPEITTLKQQVKQLSQQVGQVGTHIAMDARGRMEAELDQGIPEWRDINMEQDFLDWLALPDAYSGANRHQLLRQAFEQNQTPRVAAFFQGFLREVTASRPAEPRPAPAGQGNSPPQPQLDLSRLAAPGRSRAAAAPQPSSARKPFISRDDISRFYNDVRAGKYSGRPAEKSAAEAEIMDAQREGRIV